MPKTASTDDLLGTLKARFEAHAERHAGLAWDAIQTRLENHPAALKALAGMEATGGEPDVIGRDPSTGRVVFCDCSAETPTERRSLCYDGKALAARKENKPRSSALDEARAMGVELLTEAQYQALQALGDFDTRTSSWLATPDEVRSRGGALFGDKRYGRAFIYHNGADSYYAARGFRGWIEV